MLTHMFVGDTLPETIMEVDGMAWWMTIFTWFSTSILVSQRIHQLPLVT